MKALVFTQKGTAEDVLHVQEMSAPAPLPGQFTIRTLASPVNPNDLMFIEKQYRVTPVFPQIAGFEGCGIVIHNGGDDSVPVNSLVAFRHHGVWAEQVNVPKEKLILLPADFPVETAAQLSLNPITAWALLEQSMARAGDWIVLSAGTSAVSKLIIQFAKRRGIKTIAIIRDKSQTGALTDIGADLVLADGHPETIGKTITESVSDGTVAAFIDAVGGELATQIIPCLRVGGTVICYGLLSSMPASYYNAHIVFNLLTIQGFGIDHWISRKSKKELDAIWEEMIHQLAQPEFHMPVAGKYALQDYAEAIRVSKQVSNGKILFYFAGHI